MIYNCFLIGPDLPQWSVREWTVSSSLLYPQYFSSSYTSVITEWMAIDTVILHLESIPLQLLDVALSAGTMDTLAIIIEAILGMTGSFSESEKIGRTGSFEISLSQWINQLWVNVRSDFLLQENINTLLVATLWATCSQKHHKWETEWRNEWMNEWLHPLAWESQLPYNQIKVLSWKLGKLLTVLKKVKVIRQ